MFNIDHVRAAAHAAVKGALASPRAFDMQVRLILNMAREEISEMETCLDLASNPDGYFDAEDVAAFIRNAATHAQCALSLVADADRRFV